MIMPKERGNAQLKFWHPYSRCKNDIILTLFDGEVMSLDESE